MLDSWEFGILPQILHSFSFFQFPQVLSQVCNIIALPFQYFQIAQF